MDATNQYVTMAAAATINPIILRSDCCTGSLYLTEKNTFLEFMNDETMAAKRNAGAHTAPASPDFTPRWNNFYHYPESGYSDNKVIIPELMLPIPDHIEKTISNVELQSPDSTPRWRSDYQYSHLECSDNKVILTGPEKSQRGSWADQSEDSLTPNPTPRWNAYGYGGADKPQQATGAGDSTCGSWADQSEDSLTPATTPRWNNAHGYGDANKPPQATGVGNSQRGSWAGQSEDSLTPDTTPHWHKEQSKTMATATVPMYTDTSLGCISMPTPPSQMQPQKTQPHVVKARNTSGATANEQPQVVKPCNTTRHTSNQVPPGNFLSKAEVSSTENEGTLTISLDSLLLGGQKQSTGKPTNCVTSATCGGFDEGAIQTQPHVFHARNKKQELKKVKKAASSPAGSATTLMMRGVPCGLSTVDLMSLIDDAGLKGQYDFFYLPKDAKKSANLGYAFINFVDVQSAEHCTTAFQGIRLAPLRSPKTCSLVPASIQGLTNLSEHFKSAAAGRGWTGPIFLNVSKKQ